MKSGDAGALYAALEAGGLINKPSLSNRLVDFLGRNPNFRHKKELKSEAPVRFPLKTAKNSCLPFYKASYFPVYLRFAIQTRSI